MLMHTNTTTALDGLYREQWLIQEMQYGLFLAEFLLLLFPRLVQEPSECRRERSLSY